VPRPSMASVSKIDASSISKFCHPVANLRSRIGGGRLAAHPNAIGLGWVRIEKIPAGNDSGFGSGLHRCKTGLSVWPPPLQAVAEVASNVLAKHRRHGNGDDCSNGGIGNVQGQSSAHWGRRRRLRLRLYRK
jgi:hypothetical protein